MRQLFFLYDGFKRFINYKTSVLDLQDFPFFKNPNSQSHYSCTIRYGTFGKKIIAPSPFSRLGRGVVDEENKCIVFLTPKVASTSIIKFLHEELQLGEKMAHFKGNYHHVSLPFLLNKNKNDSKATTLYWNDYNSFAKYFIIRDPYERLVSFFKNKFINKEFSIKDDRVKLGRELMITVINITDDFLLDPLQYSFEYFITKLYEAFKNHKKLWDEHLSLQVSKDFEIIALKETKVYTLENIGMLFHALQPDSAPEKFHENKSRRESNLHIKEAYRLSTREIQAMPNKPAGASYYAPHLEEMVREIYAIDYKVYEETARKEKLGILP
ncbi:MAG: sulfotransferase family protein [Schleiferiaceae bacterium]|nr:sulfotransferase family protein [Schleiferiaceae bacterium]